MKKTILGCFIFFATIPAVRADTIFFKNGSRLDVPKLWQEEGQVRCELYGEVVSYPAQEVLRVEKSAPLSTDIAGAAVPPPATADVQRRAAMIALHNEAVAFADMGRIEDALEKERQANRLAPDNETVRRTLSILYNTRGIELKRRGDLEGALRQFELALEYGPGAQQVKKNLAAVYVEMAQKAVVKSDFSQSKELLQKAAEYDPKNAHIHILSGRIAYLEDDYATAVQDLTHALELDPNQTQARELLQKVRREGSLEENFQTRERDNFSLKFEGAQNRDLADALLQTLRDAYREMGRDFDIYPDSVVPVIIYPQSDLGQLEYFPDWASGTYDGKIRFGENIWRENLHMKAVLYHEYTHVLVRMATGTNVPFWLNEGLAEYEAHRFKPPHMIRASQKLLHSGLQLYSIGALAGMNIPKLSRLGGPSIVLCYAQSESFVTWLVNNYSFRNIRAILTRLGVGEKIQAAVRSEIGEELGVLEQKWLEELRKTD